MKKLIALLLLAAMTLSLFACGKTETPPVSDPVGTPAQPETPAEPEVPAESQVPAEPEPLWKAPEYNIENTYENRVQALLAEAKAYYYKGVMNQYGMRYLTIVPDQQGGLLRGNSLEYNTPENNTKDQILYQWCSSYLFDVVYNAFGFKELDDHERCRTAFLSQGRSSDTNIVVYQYESTGDPAKDRAAQDAAIAMLQPGDFLTWTRASDNAGHTLMVVDDMDGDGALDILHRSGERYDMNTGRDNLENVGIAKISNIEYFRKDDYLVKKLRYAIHRPALLNAEEYPITLSAQARMTYPGLQIDRTISTGMWASVCSGDTVTVSIAITNHGTADITDMPIMEPVVEGCTLLKAEGAKVTENILEWNVSVKPGETVTIAYDVKVEGNPGDTIVFRDASYAGIASNIINLTIEAYAVEGTKLQDEAVQKAAVAESKNALEFVSKMYEAATGKTVTVPTPEEFLRACYVPGSYAGTYEWKLEQDSDIFKLLLPGWMGGRRVVTEPNFRILETRMSDLQPGDIVLYAKKLADPTSVEAMIYDGDVMLTLTDGEPIPRGQSVLTSLLSYDFFVLLRPSLAG